MPHTTLLQDDPLSDFALREPSFDDQAKRLFVSGSGPAVIVLAEMPGISPHITRFARWVRDAGFTVYMPSLFGKDGAVVSADEGAAVFRKACVSAEFRALVAGQSSYCAFRSPLTKPEAPSRRSRRMTIVPWDWLRAST